MVNVTFDDCPSVPAEAAAPVMPPGTVSVTFVSGWNPDDGVKVAVAPLTCQLPAILGATVGSGVVGARAEENVSVTGPPPLASCPPPAGDTESSRSGWALGDGAAEALGFVGCLLSPALARFSGRRHERRSRRTSRPRR